jgi:ABC-type nitrate/sulfonate/bicarbonate transport system ATPase subunit
MVGLDPAVFLDRFPRDLSGGESRRLAIGMTLVAGASLMLFDEPTSQLDYLAKYQLGQIVQDIWLAQRFTALYVTHDIDEAILLGSRLLLLDEGMVKDQFEITLPRPRVRMMIESAAFTQLRNSVLERFER